MLFPIQCKDDISRFNGHFNNEFILAVMPVRAELHFSAELCLT